jgi:hypothetical protein
MDKLLELIDSIKQSIPDQKYIELMQALAEVNRGTDRARLQLNRMTEFVDRRKNSTNLCTYLPVDFFMLDEEDVSDVDLDKITMMLLVSLEHLLEKVTQLEQDVLWAVTHAQYSRKNISGRVLESRWNMVLEGEDSDSDN